MSADRQLVAEPWCVVVDMNAVADHLIRLVGQIGAARSQLDPHHDARRRDADGAATSIARNDGVIADGEGQVAEIQRRRAGESQRVRRQRDDVIA